MYICSFGKSRSSNYVSGPVDIYRTKSIPRVTPQASEELLKERICNFSLKAASFQSFLFFFFPRAIQYAPAGTTQKWNCKDLYVVSGSSHLPQRLFQVCSYLLHILRGEQVLFVTVVFFNTAQESRFLLH